MVCSCFFRWQELDGRDLRNYKGRKFRGAALHRGPRIGVQPQVGEWGRQVRTGHGPRRNSTKQSPTGYRRSASRVADTDARRYLAEAGVSRSGSTDSASCCDPFRNRNPVAASDRFARMSGSGLDPTFTALPYRDLGAVALARAQELGVSHADFRFERIRYQHLGGPRRRAPDRAATPRTSASPSG